MGRHVISVTLTGRNADLKRALDGSVRDIKKLSDAYRRAGTKLDRDLSANVRNVNRMASAFKRMHGDVDGAGRAFERFMVANDRRIRITHRVNEASSAMRKLGKVMSIVTLGMYGWQLAVSAGGIALSGLSQLLIGAAGGGVVGLFAYLGLTTEKARKEFEKLGNYIRNDLMKRTMPGFYKEVGKLPSVLKKAYNGAKPELVKLGKAMEPLIKQFNNALPKIATSLAKTLTAIVKSSKSAFKAILDSIPVLLNGIKRFFAAFKGSDASVIRKVFQDIADLLAWLGEQLAKLDASDYEALAPKIHKVK